MKKSLLITLEFPPQKGGTQKYYFDICNNLPNEKIVVLAQTQDVKHQELNTKYKVYRKNLINKFIYPHWLPMIWHLYKIIKKEKIELIQVGQVLPCGTATLIINKIFKIPYVVYTHGLDILNPKEGTRKQKLMKLILKNSQNIVANSEFTKNELIKLNVDENKIIVVYPTVENSSSAKATEDKHELRIMNQDLIKSIKNKYKLHNKKILLTVCRLVDRKGVDLVIKALSEIKDKVENLVYVVVGDGPEFEALRATRGLLVPDDKVIFTGRVSDEELSAWYELCDIFILTPKFSEFDVEGFGIVYIEANSYGKPVIGSKVGGVIEAIEDNTSGLLVEPNNTKEIADNILKLLNDEDLRVWIGTQGKIRAKKKFNITKQIENIKKILSR